MKSFSVLAVGLALASLLIVPACAPAATGCKIVEVANDVCDVLVPVIGADGKVTYVHIPPAELRATAAAKLAAPAGSR